MFISGHMSCCPRRNVLPDHVFIVSFRDIEGSGIAIAIFPACPCACLAVRHMNLMDQLSEAEVGGTLNVVHRGLRHFMSKE
jgi:hypothetical protein